MVWEQFDRVANDALSGGQLPFHKYKSDPSSHNPTVGVIFYLLYLAPSCAFLAEPVEAAPVRGDAGHHRRRAVDRDAEDHPFMLITSLQHTTAATYPPTLLPRLAPLQHPCPSTSSLSSFLCLFFRRDEEDGGRERERRRASEEVGCHVHTIVLGTALGAGVIHVCIKN